MSINDHEVIRNTFKEFNIRPVKLKYSVAKDKNTQGKEQLVTNFSCRHQIMSMDEDDLTVAKIWIYLI